jgi:hypothetical protein
VELGCVILLIWVYERFILRLKRNFLCLVAVEMFENERELKLGIF